MKKALNFLRKNLTKPFFGVLFFYIIGLIFSWTSEGVSFTDDSLEWINFYLKNGWEGFWTSYNMTSIYYFHDLFNNIGYMIFGKNQQAWFFFTYFFHALAAYLLFLFLEKLLKDFEIKNHFLISILSAFTFMFSAYSMENIYWLATYHYSITLCYLLFGLYLIAKNKGTIYWKLFWILLIPFPFFTTMFEASFMFPILFVITSVVYQRGMKETINWKQLGLFLFPFFIIIISNLWLTQYIKNQWVPHYGSGHITNITPLVYISTFINYLEKYLFFVDDMPMQIKKFFYEMKPIGYYLIFFIMLLFLFGLRKFIGNQKAWIPFILLIILWLILFIPFSSMYFFWHFPVQNDRLGYYFTVFFYPVLYFLLIVWGRSPGKLVSIVYFIINFSLFQIHKDDYREASHFYHQILMPSYEKYIDNKPIILNTPYNYKGMFVLRNKARLASAAYFFYDKDVDYIYTVSQPFFNPTDSIETKKIDSNTYEIKLKAPGAWLMNETMGGTDYENENVIVDYADDNQSAIIKIKKQDSLQPILYVTGDRGFVELK